MIVSAARVLNPQGQITDGLMNINDGFISDISFGSGHRAEHHIEGILLPGFIDIHCHGGAGFNFSSLNSQEISQAIEIHRAAGTASLTASLVSAPLESLTNSITSLQPFIQSGQLSGIHLEGPYLSPLKAGAHSLDSLRIPSITEIASLLEAGAGNIRMMTISPELPGAVEAIKYLEANGVIVAIGHTNSSLDQVKTALGAGACVVTHFNNAMPKLGSSQSAVADYLLQESGIYLELIADGVHQDSATLREILDHRADRIILVTDAMSAAGCGDGEYELGGLRVNVSAGVARLEDGLTLAGSTITPDKGFLHLIDLGIDLSDAVTVSSTNAARLFNLPALGEITAGARAEFVAYDPVRATLEKVSYSQ